MMDIDIVTGHLLYHSTDSVFELARRIVSARITPEPASGARDEDS